MTKLDEEIIAFIDEDIMPLIRQVLIKRILLAKDELKEQLNERNRIPEMHDSRVR